MPIVVFPSDNLSLFAPNPVEAGGERGGPGGHEVEPFSARGIFGFGETIIPIALIIALFT